MSAAPVLRPFAISRLPRIVFGDGRFAELPALVAAIGRSALVVMRPGFSETGQWRAAEPAFGDQNVALALETVEGEPSPSSVDAIVARHRAGGIEVVVGIGGGSVLDTAKAAAGLLIPGNSVMDHLEGVGPQLPYAGPSVPFIAVPTTAGTGSEATKNAVLSVRGTGGFKKSFRDDRLVAHTALVDPDLLASCPPPLIAGDGMDALTQLLEAYVSTRSNPMTDALALSGLAAARDGLVAWFDAATTGRGESAAARSRMAYAALCSGICLAQAGLGAVHGIASPLGALFPVPHGVACGSVLVAATRVNVAALESRELGNAALSRYAAAGRLLAGLPAGTSDGEARAGLVALLESWRSRLDVPRLSAFGIDDADVPAIVAESRGSSMKTNPIVLTDVEIAAILRESL